MKQHYELLKQRLFQSIERFFRLQDAAENETIRPTYLYTASGDKGLSDGLDFVWFVSNYITAYYLKDSPYYRNDELLERSYLALCHYERDYIREDGSVDLLCTNFHDPAQTGFHTQAIFCTTELLLRFTQHTEIEEKLHKKIHSILLKAGHALATLGFHTPNHRWVISSALAIAYRYTGEQKFLDAIEGFLMEGIDCDEYGEYTERSTGSYNNICNFSFMLMGFYLGREEFFEYPRRNLRLMYHFIEPDGTVNTLNSTRWDNGGEYSCTPYYDHYLLLALLDKNPEFAYMADSMIKKDIPPTVRVGFILTFMELHPELQDVYKELIPQEPEKDQTIFLPNSRIARIYKPEHNLTMTALASRSPVFFQMNWGSSILQLRYAGSFFGDPHSQFRARKIIPIEDGYRLICDENAGYRSQFDEKPETSNWRHMDHSKRRIINVQNFHTEITVHILEDGVALDIETSGCDRIPTKLEISMQPNGKLFTDSINMIPKEGDYVFLKGNARYFIDAYRYFEIEGGFCKHLAGNGMRGTAPVNPKKFTIAMTDNTPQKSTVTIRAKNLLTENT